MLEPVSRAAVLHSVTLDYYELTTKWDLFGWLHLALISSSCYFSALPYFLENLAFIALSGML